MPQPKQIALVGGAHIHTPGFARTLAQRDDVTTRYVWDPDMQVADARQQVTGGELVGDPQVIFKDAAVDAVVICSQTNRHETLVTEAARAGKAMFVEKPLGIRAQDAYRMAEAIEEAGVLFQTGFFRRSEARFRELRQLIQAGRFGTLTRIRLSNCHAGALGGWFDTDWRWMADLEQAGCGGFGDLGAHMVDLLLWLVDGDTPTLATASLGAVTDRYPGTDEFGEGQVRFESGLVATIAAGWVDVADPNVLEICGTQAHAIISKPAGGLIIASEQIENADGQTPIQPDDEDWPHAFDLFLDALHGADASRLVGPREAARRNAVNDAMYLGAEGATWAAIDWQ